MRNTRVLLKSLVAAIGLASAAGGAMATDSVVRIGMTAADIPVTNGAVNQGAEGLRFSGLTIYDPLINYALDRSDIPAPLVPGLATEWWINEDDKTRWTFKLREGVRFHDGSAFNADAVIFSLDRLLDSDSPQFDPRGSTQIRARIPSVAGYRKIDDYTVEIQTPTPDAMLPFQLVWMLVVSPTHWEAVGRDWNEYAARPSGTGPFRLTRLVSRERAELEPNLEYWDEKRIAKSKIVLRPIPEATARTAALLSGQVDWIEAPAPDAVPRLQRADMQIITNTYPHVWPYTLNVMEGSPFSDVRVRRAANLAVNREGLVQLLGGMAEPSRGMVEPGHPWYGNPSFEIRHDPEEARRLLAEIGHGPDNPLPVKVVISTSGSGQMQPLPMNEYIQQNMREVGIDLQFEVVEWAAMGIISRAGAKAPDQEGFHAINNSYGTGTPFEAYVRFFTSKQAPPVGRNWGYYGTPESDALIDELITTFDPAEQDKIIAKLNEVVVDDAAFVWIVKDLNPRALHPKVRGFVPPQSWYVDLTPVYMEK